MKSWKRAARDVAGLVREALGMRWKLVLSEGQAAPEFEVSDHEGNQRSLSEFRGRKLLLWFYPKADTPG